MAPLASFVVVVVVVVVLVLVVVHHVQFHLFVILLRALPDQARSGRCLR